MELLLAYKFNNWLIDLVVPKKYKLVPDCKIFE